MKTWIDDENGNRCSVEKWGSEENARKALASLENCSGCSDCFDCYDCSSCSDCSRCYDCSRCSLCSLCSRCSLCSLCSLCSGCSGCSDCSRCSRCYGCYGCSRLEASESAKGAVLIPEVPFIADLHKKIFEAASKPKALDMGAWHTCETTHCRAGWAVTLAGDAGKQLESRYGGLLAAMKIYDASCPGFKINPCRFFDDDADALADMKRLAEMEEAE